MRRIIPVLALLVAHLPLAGCGSSETIRVTGKLLKGGAAYAAPEGQRLGVTFYAIGVADGTGKDAGRGEPFAAQFNPSDSTFSVPGPEGRGIPPGKYRVSVVQKLTRDALEKATPTKRTVVVDREKDYLNGRFGPENSPIVRELKSSCDVAIDLDKPES
jgi:hypothetical protein